MLQSPLFMEYRKGQPFNHNHLRPCPMLENPELLRQMVKRSGAHSTNAEAEEDVDHLCAKCDDYAAAWKDSADAIWEAQPKKKPLYENYEPEQLKKYMAQFDKVRPIAEGQQEELRKQA